MPECRIACSRQPGILLVDDFYIGAILIVGKVLSGVVCGAVVDDYDEAFVFSLNNSYHLRLVPLFYKNRTAG